MWTRLATLLLIVVLAACQLQALRVESAEVTLTSWPSAEPLASDEEDDLGLLVAAAPPTDIVAITPTGGPIAPTRPAPTGRCTLTPNGRYDVNIREGAGTQFVINGVLRYGDFADAFGRTNSGWIEVDIPGTGSGWISSSVVTFNGPCNLQIVSENLGNPVSVVSSPTVPFNSTPTSRFLGGGSGYIYITTRPVGSIPADTQVSISTAYFNGSEYVYQVMTRNGKTGEARDADLAYAPDITPGASTPSPAFDPSWGFSFVTTAQVGNIVSGTRVRISMMMWDGYEWLYQINTDNVTTVEARESQISFYPGINPVGATPTSALLGASWTDYIYVTTERVGNIPANTRVRIGSAMFDGYGWLYNIASEDNQLYAEARDSQLMLAPGIIPIGATPTSQYLGFANSGFVFVTTTEVSLIPANTRVAIMSGYYDYYGRWLYQIVTEDGTTAEAGDFQLAYAPGASTPMPTAVECRAMANTALGAVNIRNGPGAHFAALNAFGTNDAVSVLGRSDNGWYLVRMYAFGNPFEGFAPAGEIALSGDCDYLTVLPASNFAATPAVQELPTDVSPNDVVIPDGLCTVIATTGSVNIYSQNRADSTVVGVLQPGPWLQANARDDKGWYRVTLLNGGLGWVNGSQLQVNGLGIACESLSIL
jgi:uncharacterized protein YgiM (DUF1202 family)